MLKQAARAALIVLLMATLPRIAEAEAPIAPSTRLRLGSDVWPPFTDREGRRRVAIDLVERALARAGVSVEVVITPALGDVMTELREGSLDGSAAFWRSQEREALLLYSKPYLENRLVLLARKGTDVSANVLDDLDGERVGIVAGYAYTDTERLPADGDSDRLAAGPEFSEASSDQENLDRLLRGDIDYMLAEELVIHEFFQRHGERAELLLEAGTNPLITRSLHFVLRRDLPAAREILDHFDRSIREMAADGTFNEALGLVWLRVDLDGDGEAELVLGGTKAGTKAPTSGYPILGENGANGNDPSSTYVVGGRRYGSWNDVPSEFKVPVERNDAWPEPTIRLLEF